MLGLRHHQGVAIDLFQGDITQFVCDAMVNAANAQLAGGGGVDGAIHRVGGPEIMAECQKIGGCPTGEAVVTTAGKLPCQKLIHTVGPKWQGGKAEEALQLASAYRNSLAKADEWGLRHVAFPSISTGVYGYPIDQAADVAMSSFQSYVDKRTATAVQRITMVLFSLEDYKVYEQALIKLFPEETV